MDVLTFTIVTKLSPFVAFARLRHQITHIDVSLPICATHWFIMVRTFIRANTDCLATVDYLTFCIRVTRFVPTWTIVVDTSYIIQTNENKI